MYLIDSSLKNEIKKIHYLKKATVFIFENFLVVEYNQDAIVDFDCIAETYHLLSHYSEQKNCFGYISNRVHKYTLKIADFIKIKSLAQKKYPTAIVIYDEQGLNEYKFEQQIANCKAIVCKSLNEAVNSLSLSLTKAC
ncbi:hypothetical protein [uncultured Dokdonia sp.]|uniref:hypothetical protein n=1 Tax=uncultured Dokdonia sp. TaxID=575653 RepID=UPI00261AC385|nr:hypothetical protein [uncultured Dokdonia sp.]